jgi:hypothetical protein
VAGRIPQPYQLDIRDDDGSLGLNLGVYGAPETFFIDAKGIIRDKYVGVIDERSGANNWPPSTRPWSMRPSHEALVSRCGLGLSLAGVAHAAIDTYEFANDAERERFRD